MLAFLLIIIIITTTAASAAPISITALPTRINVTNPAFVELLSLDNTTNGKTSLFVTQFGVLDGGAVHYCNDIYSHASSNFANLSFTSVGGFTWPNRVSPIPPNALGDTTRGFIVPDGFLVPFHSNGGVYMVTLTTDGQPNTPVRLDSGKKGWFYHMVEWRDMNNDGRLDIVTARATKPLFGATGAELLWLEQPSSSSSPWTEHVITNGPDILFTIIDHDTTDHMITVIAAEFLAKSLVAYNIDTNTGTLINKTVIDDQVGPAYKPIYVDVNGDGVRDLLVNNHVGGSGGDVYAYDGVGGFKQRHTLALNVFKVVVEGPGAASPGLIYPFFTPASKQPYILVAGDGSGAAYLMTPTTSSEWTYTISTFYTADKTIGSLGVPTASTNPSYIFTPVYESNFVQPFIIKY